MRHGRERAAMLAALVLAPALYLGFWFLPAQRTIDDLRNKRQALEAEHPAPALLTRLSAEERAFLEEPGAPWRQRLPLLQGDAQRLQHYDRVVASLQDTWRGGGVRLLTLRSSWDPIRASFSLPGGLAGAGSPAPAASLDSPSLKLQAWVLEARVDGQADRLFQALALLPKVPPLLEPVGLRWEAGPEERRQYLVLRNTVLTP